MVNKPKTIKGRIERLETPKNKPEITAFRLAGIVHHRGRGGQWIETPEKDYKGPQGDIVINLTWGDDDK